MSSKIKLGVTLRNMGPQSTPQIMRSGVLHAEALGYESVWITDHIAIPPDDAQGSGGRYTDPLTTLSWFAGLTQNIKLGSGVLILPYRPILPTAKAIATLQEVSDERLLLGVGIGWMDAEFNALGIPRRERGVRSDATLRFLQQCFEQDEVSLNGQKFLFKPRPQRPPILVGGRPPMALRRAAELGDGWLPMAKNPEQIAQSAKDYRELTLSLGKPPGQISVMTNLGSQLDQARTLLDRYADLGVERVIAAVGYDTEADYRYQLDQLRALVDG
ncbi:MAG: TIGR03619 family F420-dependent LLM class oxidoreductase [Pseudomonadota bacterium]